MAKAKRRNPEEILQLQICEYMDLQYPDVIYTSDLSGIRLPIGLAKKSARMRCKKYKIPDLIILHPNKHYSGLILELKATDEDLYLKNGQYRNTEHINAQKDVISRLHDIGYHATFSVGFDRTKHIIDNYMKL